jgi:hypothetical protein
MGLSSRKANHTQSLQQRQFLSVDLRSSLEPSKARAVLGKISAYNFGGCSVTP